jgi:UDP-N-acetylmuramoyl-tripeptide--D-alanyl-D-alanine ligase
MDITHIHSLFLKCSSISIDTRKIEKNSFFVAIKGDNFDANTFVKKALNNGALYAIIDNKEYYIDERTILVEDSLIALQELAKFHRSYLKLPIIALTGSNGKTTTKELIQVVLSKKYQTKATVGNLNNHIGVPLTLLSFTSETEIGIVEMGANHKREIEFLCNIANPDYGYITNFGKAHLEGFGGVEGVIEGKSEMYQNLRSHDKLVFVNIDDAIQVSKSLHMKMYSFSLNNATADLKIKSIAANPFVVVTYEDSTVYSNLIGLYNANNLNAAIAIGKYFEVPDVMIKAALEEYVPENNRSQMLKKGNNQIILDAYNANPSSMAVAIDNFLQLDVKADKVMVLGDMFELGLESMLEHQAIVSRLSKDSTSTCYLIGSDFYSNAIKREHLQFFESFDRFSEFLKEQRIENCMLLIKGSRGMALERTLDFL